MHPPYAGITLIKTLYPLLIVVKTDSTQVGIIIFTLSDLSKKEW